MKGKIDFQDGHNHYGGHLGFPIRMILAIVDPQVALIFPTKFRISWPFGSVDEGQNRVFRWPPD